MDDVVARPVARAWELTGGDLHDRGVAEAVRAEFIPLLEELPGHLGAILLVDRGRRLMRGVSFWTDPDARDAAGTILAPRIEVAIEVSQATFRGTWLFDVGFSRFRGKARVDSDGAAEEVDPMLVRVAVFEDGTAAEPAMVDLLRSHLATTTDLPGCLGSLMLVDRDRATVIAGSMWTDASAAERTTALAADSFRAIVEATGSTSPATQMGTFEVLVNRPIPRLV